MSIIDSLIFDREQADVDAAAQLRQKVASHTATPAEMTRWLNSDLKGTYNASDLDRVERAVRYLDEELAAYGYAAGTIGRPEEWTKEDFPTESDMQRYLKNLRALRNTLRVLATTPDIPASMAFFGFAGANDIEKMLFDIDRLISWMLASFRHCGTFNSGMEGLRL